tara:strand:+ start:800 stop:925 length:126 start_codon:yes stop_codon:yes gene_type:complete
MGVEEYVVEGDAFRITSDFNHAFFLFSSGKPVRKHKLTKTA